MSFSPRAFRDCLGQFATGVAVVTMRDKQGEKAGITINSFASVSLDPALVLFSVDRRAATHAIFEGATAGAGAGAGTGQGADGDGDIRFCINILSRQQQAISELFATPGQPLWDQVPHDHDVYGTPRLTGNLASFSCVRHALHDGGDHSIVVGRVADIDLGPAGEPLLYFRGGYCQLAK